MTLPVRRLFRSAGLSFNAILERCKIGLPVDSLPVLWPPANVPPGFPLLPYKHGWCREIDGVLRHFCRKVDAAEAIERFHENPTGKGCRVARAAPPKPYAGFPLFAHQNGSWIKKIRGRRHSFGPWEPVDDRDAYVASWHSALKNYERFDEARVRGELVAAQPRQIRLSDLVERYLNARHEHVRRGDFAARTYVDVRGVLEAYRDGVGESRTVAALEADASPLNAYIDALRERYGWTTFNRHMRYVATMWRWAAKPTSAVLDRAFHFFELHRGRSLRERRRQLRLDRAHGRSRFFDVDEIRSLIAHASPPLRAAILLGYFGGYGNQDVADLPRTALEVFDRDQTLRFGGRTETIPLGWAKLHFPRPKSEIDRHAIVPAVVVDALRVADRAMPATPATQHLLLRADNGSTLQREVFHLDARGRPERHGMVDNLAQQFGRLVARIGRCATHGLVERAACVGGAGKKAPAPACPTCNAPLTMMRKRGFYCLRHTSTTIAVASGASPDTRSLWEGHTDGSVRMAYYVEPAQVSDLVLIARELAARLTIEPPSAPMAVAV